MTDAELKEGALVFGYMDMHDAPSRLQWFTLRQVKPKTKEPYWQLGVHKNVFSHQGLPVGSYQLSRFGGMSGLNLFLFYLGGQQYEYSFPVQAEGFRIEGPGVRFLGSWKYVKAGSFWNEKFDIRPIPHPNEREVLERLLPDLKDKPWLVQRARKRLAELP